MHRLLLKEKKKLHGYIDFLFLGESEGQPVYFLAGFKTDSGLQRYPYDLASTDLLLALHDKMKTVDGACLVVPLERRYFFEENGWENRKRLQSYNAHGQTVEQFEEIMRQNTTLIVGYSEGVLMQERQERSSGAKAMDDKQAA